MSNNKKKILKYILGSDFGCGCRKTSLSDVVQPQPNPPRVPPSDNHKSNPTSYTSREDRTSSTFSLHIDSSQNCSESKKDRTPTAVDVNPRTVSRLLPSSSGVGGSIEVVKESDHPYWDFRDSMLRMILEKRIYSRDGLEDLLRCFLELNSPCLIIHAFAEIRKTSSPIERPGSHEIRPGHGGICDLHVRALNSHVGTFDLDLCAGPICSLSENPYLPRIESMSRSILSFT